MATGGTSILFLCRLFLGRHFSLRHLTSPPFKESAGKAAIYSAKYKSHLAQKSSFVKRFLPGKNQILDRNEYKK